MSALPTLIFCSGAWHTPEYWHTIKQILEDKGYKCIAPHIIYNGRSGDTAVQSLTPVIEALQEVIAAETTLENDVVLVNHSMGGIAGTSAVKGFTKQDQSRPKNAGAVIGLVQLAGWLPVANEVSLADMAQDFAKGRPQPEGVQLVVEDSGQGWCELRGDPAKSLYNDMTDEQGMEWVSKLVKFSSALRQTRDSVYAGWMDVPMWYLICTEDKTIVRELQEHLVRRCSEGGARVTTRECKAGHSPMLSQPQETVTFVEDAVKAFGSRGRL